MGIATKLNWYEPRNPYSELDIDATDRAFQLKAEYNDPAILITANGISESGDSNEANDWWRKQYFVGYINEMMKAMKMDDVNVIGYTAWSFMDQFEWDQGYSERFGSHWVNFTDPARPRIPKQSSYCYNEIIRRSFPEDDTLTCCQKYVDRRSPDEPEEDVDECAGTNPCGPNTVCTNTIGSYACSCLPGYTGDDAGCIDINECENKDACGENEECMNTEGSF